jgi:hypothetical protein
MVAEEAVTISLATELEEYVRRTRFSAALRASVVRVRQRHELERRIVALESRGLNASRTEQIRHLRRQLAEL